MVAAKAPCWPSPRWLRWRLKTALTATARQRLSAALDQARRAQDHEAEVLTLDALARSHASAGELDGRWPYLQPPTTSFRRQRIWSLTPTASTREGRLSLTMLTAWMRRVPPPEPDGGGSHQPEIVAA